MSIEGFAWFALFVFALFGKIRECNAVAAARDDIEKDLRKKLSESHGWEKIARSLTVSHQRDVRAYVFNIEQ
jgi:hypothetical protein